MLETETSKRINDETKNLIETIYKMDRTPNIFFEYLTRTQQLNERVSKKIKNELINFEEFYPKTRDHHMPKFEPMMSFIENLKNLCAFIEKVSKDNLMEFSKISIGNDREENEKTEKTKKKAQTFDGNMEEFRTRLKTYNKKYQDYELNCEKLKSTMSKSNFTENPIHFYNLKTDTEATKSIERKFQECENAEKDLIGNLELLEQKRKNICENLKDIREEYIVSFSNSMNQILQGSKILVDFKKDGLFPKERRSSESKERLIDQIQRDDLDELDEMLNDRNKDLRSNCEEYKTRLIQRTEKLLSTQKRFSQELTNEIAGLEKSSDELETISKESAKVGMGNINEVLTQVKSFCGNSMLSIVHLSILVAENPIRVLSSIGKVVGEKEKKVRRIVEENEESLKEFKKNASSTLSDGKYSNLNGPNSERNLRSSLRNEISFKDVVNDFIRFQKGLDLEFNDILLQLNDYLITQSQQILLHRLLKKEKEQTAVRVLEEFEPEEAIVNTIQNDRGYDFLFRDETFQQIHLSNFKSALHQRPEEAKQILQKKASLRSSVVGISRTGCCGIESKKSKREKTIVEATLIGNNTSKFFGQIEISQKGLAFLEKKGNPFTDKMELWIPINEIRSFHKSTSNLGVEVIEITTSMGTLNFTSDKNSLLEETFEKNLISKTDHRKLEVEKDEKLERSKSGELSFSGRQSSSYNYKVNFDSGIIDPGITNGKSTKKIKESLLLKEFSEKLKTTKFFSDELIGSKIVGPENEYNYDGLYVFKLIEKRIFQTATGNEVTFKFDWKVSFPDPVLKSYHHFEVVKIELNEERVKLTFSEQRREDQHLITRKTFYQEVEKMNRNVSNFSAKYCERHCEVVVENDIQNTEYSQFSDLTMSEFGIERSFSRI